MNPLRKHIVYYNPTPNSPIEEHQTVACTITGAVRNIKKYAPRKVNEFTVMDPETGKCTDTVVFGPRKNVAIVSEDKE